MRSSISSLACLVACASGLLSSGTEAAAQFAFEHANYWVREDEGTVQVVVQRGGSVESAATVGYATTNGTAKAGDDYVAASGTLAFAAGEAFKTLLVAIPNNGVRNSNRTFTLGLNQVSPDAGLSSPRIASIAVLDNDPGIEFASPRLWVHESEGSVTLTVIRGNDARLEAFAVDYETADGTALAGRDYVASRGTLNFGVGETRRSFPVPVLGTASPAKDRQFRVSLLRPSEGFALGSSTTAVATVTICDSREMLAHRWVASRPTNDGAISLALVGGHTAGLGSSNRFVGDFDIVPVEVSTNLADWSSRAWLTRAPGGTNATVWTDAEGGSGPIRFYRTPATTFPAPQRPPSGPYPVGFTDRILADDTRRNRFRVSTNTTFPVTVWYPARRPAGAWPSEPYHPAEFARDPRPGAWEGDVDRAPYWKRYALRDVPVADGLSRLPVVVWSSGYLYARFDVQEWAEHLASFGYVVAAADPPDAAIVSYPDGRYIYTHFSDAAGRGLDARLLRSRVRDCEVTLDALARWNAEDGVFAGRLNTEAAAAMGWSLGGGTAVEWCRVDSRVVAAIALDGAFLDLAPLRASGMSKPVLAMNRPGNTSLDLFGALKGDAIFFEIRNTVHESFSAYYWDLDSNPGDRGREAARTVVDHAVWFLDRSLKEKSDPFPSAADYRLVTNLRRK